MAISVSLTQLNGVSDLKVKSFYDVNQPVL